VPLRADTDVFKLYVNTSSASNYRSRRVSYDKQTIVEELKAKINELQHEVEEKKRQVDEKDRLCAATAAKKYVYSTCNFQSSCS
jgi:hypothetical protein